MVKRFDKLISFMHAVVIGIALAAQQSQVDQARVDAAIDRGCKWILTLKKEDLMGTTPGSKRNQARATYSNLELVLLTLIHSGSYKVDHPDVAAMLDTMLSREFGSVYTTSLQAMILQKIDPEKFLPRLAECAHYLTANQAQNGQWDYGEKPACNIFKPPEKPKGADEPLVVTDAKPVSPSSRSHKPLTVGNTQILQKLRL